MTPIGRVVPVRVGLAVLAVVVYAANQVALAYGVDGTTLATAVVGLLTVAIGGDTMRPSGMVPS